MGDKATESASTPASILAAEEAAKRVLAEWAERDKGKPVTEATQTYRKPRRRNSTVLHFGLPGLMFLPPEF